MGRRWRKAGRPAKTVTVCARLVRRWWGEASPPSRIGLPDKSLPDHSLKIRKSYDHLKAYGRAGSGGTALSDHRK